MGSQKVSPTATADRRHLGHRAADQCFGFPSGGRYAEPNALDSPGGAVPRTSGGARRLGEGRRGAYRPCGGNSTERSGSRLEIANRARPRSRLRAMPWQSDGMAAAVRAIPGRGGARRGAAAATRLRSTPSRAERRRPLSRLGQPAGAARSLCGPVDYVRSCSRRYWMSARPSLSVYVWSVQAISALPSDAMSG
jgi:hypothetical protein